MANEVNNLEPCSRQGWKGRHVLGHAEPPWCGKIYLLLWVDKKAQETWVEEWCDLMYNKWSARLQSRKVSVGERSWNCVIRKTLSSLGKMTVIWKKAESAVVMRIHSFRKYFEDETNRTCWEIEHTVWLNISKNGLWDLSLNNNGKPNVIFQDGQGKKEQMWVGVQEVNKISF